MKRMIGFVIIISVIISMVFIVNCGKGSDFHTGYVECDEIDVASKIPGRILEMKIKAGDRVKKGDLIATLESKDILAKVEQARAGLEAAKAQLQMALNGARKEEKAMVLQEFNMAKNNLELVEKTHNRVLKVYKEGGVSEQEKDMSELRWKVARDQYEKAKNYRDLIDKGARSEQIDALKANVRAMLEKVNEADSFYEETGIKAPQDGEIKQVNAQAGEIITAGFPLVSLLDKENYIIFNLRENKFNGLKTGDSVKVFIPALQKETSIAVYYIAPMADFAKYEATRERGAWDVKTFEVRAHITEILPGIRPGMSVQIFE
jgi:HlyD family secretion protein